jgi:peptidoglycan hydrolase-like protein with peptidoglycan-binding domain
MNTYTSTNRLADLVQFSIAAFSLSVCVLLATSAQASAYTQIYQQLDPGERGQEVTNLQTFLADNRDIYPSGLVTGYYGSLTTSAVKVFQGQYGFDQVGRVGPLTINKINSIITNGGWANGSNSNGVDNGASPMIGNLSQNVQRNSATMTWYTNENATGSIFYNTNPITFNEGDIHSVGFGITSGYIATNNNSASAMQQVTIQNLQPGTLYYYMIVATDPFGNVSVYNVNGTFRTTTY